MKRYLIFGFLTILIITLNFAFIIVMVKEDVEINYAVLFLLWIVVIVAAAGLAYLEKSRKKSAIAAELKEDHTPEDPLRPKAEEVSPNLIYKKKSLQKFRIPLSEDFSEKVKPGFFGGYIITEEFGNENVQSVYSDEGQLLGFISKNEEQLCQNLEQLYKDPIICWGRIVKQEDDTFLVKGHVPVLFSEPEINRFRKLIFLKKELLEMQDSEVDIDTEIFLEKAENFSFQEQSEKTPSSLDYHIDPEILANFSRASVNTKNWKKVLELERFPVLISRLEQPYKEEVQNALKKARRKLEE